MRETWASTQEMKKNYSFKRKIYGQVYNNVLKRYEKRINENLQQLYKKPSLCQYLVQKRLKWAGHVWRALRVKKN